MEKSYTPPLLRQGIGFALVGGAATAVQYVLLIVLVELANIDPSMASSIGFCVSALFNYYLNYHFTFRSKESHCKSGPKFFVIALLGLAINFLIMMVLIQNFSIHYVVAQVFATTLVMLWNFFANRSWTFKIE